VTGAETERLNSTDGRVTGSLFDARTASCIMSKAGRGHPLRRRDQLAERSWSFPAIGRPDLLSDARYPAGHALRASARTCRTISRSVRSSSMSGAKTLNQRYHNLASRAAMGLEYALRRTGPLSMAPSQLGIFRQKRPAR
jgi:choline dehydrogenase